MATSNAFAASVLSDKTARTTVNRALIQSYSISEQVQAMSASVQKKFSSTLISSIQAGEGLGKLSARISGGTVDGEAIPGFMKITRSQSQALAHTAITAVSKQERLEAFQANASVINAIQQLSTLDNSTTDICIAYSDLMWDVTSLQPIGHSLPWAGGPPRHFNCRSVIIPVVKSPQDLGVATKGKIPPEVRATMDGQAAKDISFAEWLKPKSPQFIDELLGKDRGKMFRAGKLALQDMINFNGRPATIAQLAKVSVPASAVGTGFSAAKLNLQSRNLFDGMDYADLGAAQRKEVIASLKSGAKTGLDKSIGAGRAIPAQRNNVILNKIKEKHTGSEVAANLFDSSGDAAANLADEIGEDVSQSQLLAAREEAYNRTQRLLANGPDHITVYRGGPIRGEIVPVTTDRQVAERFALKSGGTVKEYLIPRDQVLLDMRAINGTAGFQESELLVKVNSLTEEIFDISSARRRKLLLRKQ